MKQVVWIPQAQRRLFPLRVQLGHTVTHLSAQSKPCSVPQDTSSAHRKGSAQFSANPYQVKKRTPSRLPCPKKRDLKYPIEGGRREERNKALHKRWGPVNTCWKGVILGKSQRSPLGQVLKGEKKEIVSRQFAPTGSKLFTVPCPAAPWRELLPLKPGPPSRTPVLPGIAAAAPGVHSPRGPHQPLLNRETCHLGAHRPTWLKLWGLPYAERRASYAGFSPQPCN